MIHPSPSLSACAAKNTGFGRNANPLLRGAMPGTLTLDGLEKLVRGGEIDTVLVAFPDQQGRLMGKRVTGTFFLDQVARGGMHACRSEEHTSELQSLTNLVCRLLLEK